MSITGYFSKLQSLSVPDNHATSSKANDVNKDKGCECVHSFSSLPKKKFQRTFLCESKMEEVEQINQCAITWKDNPSRALEGSKSESKFDIFHAIAFDGNKRPFRDCTLLHET